MDTPSKSEKSGTSRHATLHRLFSMIPHTKKRIFLLIAVVLILSAGGMQGVRFLVHRVTHESTDDAFVTGTIVPVAAEVRGRITRVYVEDNQRVKAGEVLVEIFPDDYSNKVQESRNEVSRLVAEDRELRASMAQQTKALEQARASLSALQAEERLAEKDLKRYEALHSREVVSTSDLDRVDSQWRIIRSRRQAAEAAADEADAAIKTLQAKSATQVFKIEKARSILKTAELDLSRTILTAPIEGTVAMKKADPGKYVQPGQPLLSIVGKETWIVANFKETQIKKMAVNQPVDIIVDAYPGVRLRGRVDSLQSGTGAVFSLLPPENATGNFVKVVQRVPVKITIESPCDPAHPLWPGLSVVPVVDVRPAAGTRHEGG